MVNLSSTELIATLRSLAESDGLHTTASQTHTLTAEREIPLGKWFLGGRKAVYRMSCDIDDAAHDVRFCESTRESSWGVPPPSFTTEVTSQSGSRIQQTTTVKSPSGGGTFDIGHVRGDIETAVSAAGWQFHLDAGRRP
jgi:hypothetical protein